MLLSQRNSARIEIQETAFVCLLQMHSRGKAARSRCFEAREVRELFAEESLGNLFQYKQPIFVALCSKNQVSQIDILAEKLLIRAQHFNHTTHLAAISLTSPVPSLVQPEQNFPGSGQQ